MVRGLSRFAALIVSLIALFVVLGAWSLTVRSRRARAQFVREVAVERRDAAERRFEASVRASGHGVSVTVDSVEPEALQYGPEGVEVRSTLSDAIDAIADSVERMTQNGRLRGRRIREVGVIEAHRRDDAPDIRSARLRLVKVLRMRGVNARDGEARRFGGMTLEISLRKEGEEAELLGVYEREGGFMREILIEGASAGDVADAQLDFEMRKLPRSDRSTLRFKTGVTLSPDDAREDALDLLARRIRKELWSMALVSTGIDETDASEFERRLWDRYSRDFLVGLGALQTRPETLEVDGDTFHRVEVRWVASRRDLQDLAKGVALSMLAERREPWLKLGFSLGFAVLALLLWLKVDWLLKGHFAVLSKLGFVILVVMGVGLIWSLNIHV
ncbi:MAG TPA: hypothetical protein ENK43_16970 [Planctomycetes bacterium]|nr:hypothetical protein [Planctomycetota bacterium]